MREGLEETAGPLCGCLETAREGEALGQRPGEPGDGQKRSWERVCMNACDGRGHEKVCPRGRNGGGMGVDPLSGGQCVELGPSENLCGRNGKKMRWLLRVEVGGRGREQWGPRVPP